MTFIDSQNNEAFKYKEFQSEIKEEKRFRSFMFVGIAIILFPIFYFTVCAFSPSEKVEKVEKELIIEQPIASLEKEPISLHNETEKISFNSIVETNFDKRTEILSLVDQKDIFHISSSKPEGFYVMVGSFIEYKNARKLEKMNPTNYVCYIFEPNYKAFNRVGLFISKDDLKKTQNALVEIKNMQPESWILYNTLN